MTYSYNSHGSSSCSYQVSHCKKEFIACTETNPGPTQNNQYIIFLTINVNLENLTVEQKDTNLIFTYTDENGEVQTATIAIASGMLDNLQIQLIDGTIITLGEIAQTPREPENGIVDGTSGNDVIKPGYEDRAGEGVGNGDDVVDAGAGDDVILGYGGDDRLIGGAGDDYLVGHDGTDTAVFNGNFADYKVAFDYNLRTGRPDLPHFGLTVTDNAGDDGTDVLVHMEKIEFADGVTGEITYENNRDAFSYITFKDKDGKLLQKMTLDTSENRDWDYQTTTYHPDGSIYKTETFYDDGTRDEIIVNPLPDTSPSSTVPTNGDDVLVGSRDADILRGLDGDDRLIGGGGNDYLDGGNGTDTIAYSGNFADFKFGYDPSASYTTTTRLGAMTVTDKTGAEGTDTFTDEVEKIAFADGVTGTIKPQNAQGITVIDFRDDAGNLVGRFMMDKADNKPWTSQMLTYDENGKVARNETVQDDGRVVEKVYEDGVLVDTIVNGESTSGGATTPEPETGLTLPTTGPVTMGSSAADRLNGTSGNDHLDGAAGNDVLSGYDGDDILVGGLGNDNIFGGNGADYIKGGAGDDALGGGAGADVFSFESGDGKDRVRDFEDSVDRLQIEGASFDQLTITETGAGTVITYGNGDQIILRGVTRDQITEDDFIFGGADNGSMTPNPTPNVAPTSAPEVLPSGAIVGKNGDDDMKWGYRDANGNKASEGADVMSGGAGNDFLVSGGGNDTIYGGAGNDTIWSDAGDDVIYGGTGDDDLTGDDGDDIFVFVAGDGNDTVNNFRDNEDKLQFNGLTFADLTITKVGGSTQIEYGDGGSIILNGTERYLITQDDFLFV